MQVRAWFFGTGPCCLEIIPGLFPTRSPQMLNVSVGNWASPGSDRHPWASARGWSATGHSLAASGVREAEAGVVERALGDPADLARVYTASRGWAAPLGWDNIDADLHPQSGAAPSTLVSACPLGEVAVERAVAGDGIHLDDFSLPEQAEVVHRRTDRGRSIREIADLLATTTRTVSRRREFAVRAA